MSITRIQNNVLSTEMIVEKTINLESRRYIGNKSKLTSWIFENIQNETKKCKTFFDVFAGTANVTKTAINYYENIITNDILFSNNVIYKAFFEKGQWNKIIIDRLLNYYNSINPEVLKENYFSDNFGNKFFDFQNSKLIGYIREDIEKQKNELSEKEYNILLATLIYNIDKIANTVGHFDAYIKKLIKYRKLELKLIETSDFENIEIYREDANKLAKQISEDIAYIDPPYNSRQYNRFYHIYENLVMWEKPELFGVALKPKPENNSLYCTVKAKETFRDLIETLNVKYLAVSYNNTYNSKSHSSENKIKLEEIEEILNQKGETKVFENSHKFFNIGKTEFENHKEILFITKTKKQ